ncbi:MAG: hypothetical protein K8I27_10330 [Planctomycetes bacterium]|nr:hypothetical protein [Planctomycetota bacterium]
MFIDIITAIAGVLRALLMGVLTLCLFAGAITGGLLLMLVPFALLPLVGKVAHVNTSTPALP